MRNKKNVEWRKLCQRRKRWRRIIYAIGYSIDNLVGAKNRPILYSWGNTQSTNIFHRKKQNAHATLQWHTHTLIWMDCTGICNCIGVLEKGHEFVCSLWKRQKTNAGITHLLRNIPFSHFSSVQNSTLMFVMHQHLVSLSPSN